MDAHFLFSLSGPFVLIGWLALLLSPLRTGITNFIAVFFVPAILSIAYTSLVLVNWSGAPGGFGSLADVMLLFTVPEIALAGWLHYLAFDLFVGAWEIKTARRVGISYFLVLPCLVFTFLFGPAGFLLFLIIWGALRFTGKGLAHA